MSRIPNLPSQVRMTNNAGQTSDEVNPTSLVVRPLSVEIDGERIDKYITERLAEVSRAEVQRLIKDGYVTLNGAIVKPSQRVEKGDKIVVRMPPPEPVELLPEPIPLDVVYEDADVLLINKPAGLVVHPAAGHTSGTLVNAILAHVPGWGGRSISWGGSSTAAPTSSSSTFAPTATGIGGELRPGIVHRLDKDTSGLILVAKNDGSLRKLQNQFKNRLVSKIYLALVEGRLIPEQGRIDAPIGRDQRARKRMAVSPRRGRLAQTDYRVLEYLGEFSLVEVRPLTGRTHQIRVHFAAAGHPIAGDPVYGPRKRTLPLDRQFLHAWQLSFDLPSTGERVTFTAPLPEDLREVLETLGMKVGNLK